MEKSPITDLIDRWDTRQQFADEIGAKVASVHKWSKANRIPPWWQRRVVEAAQSRGFSEITADWMLDKHDGVRGGAS